MIEDVRRKADRLRRLKKTREVVLSGWCPEYVGVTDKGLPANHIGNNVPVLDRNGKPVLDEKNQPTFIFCPTVKWSLIGAMMVACEVGPSTFPNAAFGDLANYLMRFAHEWTFLFGTYQFNYLADFNSHSVPREEEFDENGKKLRAKDLIRKYGSSNHTTTVEDVVELLDQAIFQAGVDQTFAKIALNADYPLHVPTIDQTSPDNTFYNPDLARRITEEGQRIVREMNEKVTTVTDRATIAVIESREDLGDNLSVYRVLGNTVVGMKEDGRHRFRVGELVVYVPLDMLVPDDVLKHRGYWNEAKGVGSLGGSKGNRVKARAFVKTDENPGGTESIGLIWKVEEDLDYLDGPNMPPEVSGYYIERPDGHIKFVKIGDDVTEFFGLRMFQG